MIKRLIALCAMSAFSLPLWAEDHPVALFHQSGAEAAKDLAKIHAEERAEIAALRAKHRNDLPPTGSRFVQRTREEQLEVAKIAIADANDLFLKQNLMHGEDIEYSPNDRLDHIDIDADFVNRYLWACSDALRMDNPIYSIAVESKRLLLGREERRALILTCKTYWAGLVRSAHL